MTAPATCPPGPDALRLVERHETARAVYRILDRLPERDRQVLVLFELEDLSADEVGQLLGIQAANARLRLHRARARFLRLYEQMEAKNPGDERSNDVRRR
jgi:RNA polymerase sigma-70 factor (ECF subfamily)